MTEGSTHILVKLIEISKVDSARARIVAEKKGLEKSLSEKVQALKKQEQDGRAKSVEHEEVRNRYQKEEKRLREEQQKLIERRKALGSFSNYKLQQKAEREIEQAAKVLGTHEERLVGMLDQLEGLEKESATIQETLAQLRKDYEEFEKEAKELSAVLENQQLEKDQERAGLTANVDIRILSQYDRILERYPADALVPLNGTKCSACYMENGPQVVVRIGRGDELVKCRGCARIIYIEGSKGE